MPRRRARSGSRWSWRCRRRSGAAAAPRVAAGLHCCRSSWRSRSRVSISASTIPRRGRRHPARRRVGDFRLRAAYGKPSQVALEAAGDTAPCPALDRRLMRRSVRARSPSAGPRSRRYHPGGELLSAVACSSRAGLRMSEGDRGRGRLVAASSRSRSRRLWRTAPPSCSCAGGVPSGARGRRSSACRGRRRFLRVIAPPRSRSPPAPAPSCRSWRRCWCR